MEESTDFYEDFNINETDLEYAMNPGKYRYQTKEQQLYGVFATESDEEDEKNSGRPSFSSSKRKPNYSAPISFISGGIKKENKIEKNDEIVGDDENEYDKEKERKRSRREYSGFGSTNRSVGEEVFAGMRSTQGLDTNSMAWTKNSGKGTVIMQMMQKMGYVSGKGLGAKKQGIVEPVQAFLRPGRGAIGAYGKECKGPKFGESAADAQNRLNDNTKDGNASENFNIRKENWKKSNSGKKSKVYYKTLDDVVNDHESSSNCAPIFKSTTLGVKIIDMTGPEQKVYNDFNLFARRAKAPVLMESDRTKFDVPELISNLNTLIDLTEDEIRRNDRELKFLKDQTEVLNNEQSRLSDEYEKAKSEISQMVEVANIMREFQKISSKRTPTLDECRDLFFRLHNDYAVVYKLYGLESLAKSSVMPVLKAHFLQWQPLDPVQVKYGWEVMEEWKNILTECDKSNPINGKRSMFDHFKHDSDFTLSVYDYCVWEGWMPSVRRAALTWSPRNNGPAMMDLVETWLPLLPRWIAENLLDQIIVPRIKNQVDEWDPRLDAVPIDSWLLPWREVMGDRLLLVYSIIRQKLKKGLENWRPGDRSAIESIRPWKDVFSSGAMHSFLGMSIVPKLELALQTIDINTVDQFKYLELFDWMELIHVDVICQLLIKNFFPRFYDCLYAHLTIPNMSSTAVDYYKNWRNILPKNIVQIKVIQNELSKALNAITRVKNGLMPMPPIQNRLPTLGPQSLHQFSNYMPSNMPPPPPPPVANASFFRR